MYDDSMKRDMDLCRRILLALEEHEHGRAPETLDVGASEDAIGYHVYLLHGAGLLEAFEYGTKNSKGPMWHPKWLTWAGHEFITAARPQTRWDKVKAIAARAGGVGLDTLVALLTSEVAKDVGL